MKIAIIGAGIGGLTTALALEQRGFEASIYEQAQELQPVGAGIILANNAMQVYQKLGLYKDIENIGNEISSLKITTSQLDNLSAIDLSYFEKKFKTKTIAIHRGSLQNILINNLKTTKIITGFKLSEIRKDKKLTSLLFENGKEIKANIVIGADGIHSKVRELLFPNSIIRQCNQLCWRGIVNFKLPSNYANQLVEAWGKSSRFGFVKISENKVYWYALKTIKKNQIAEDLVLYQSFKEFNPIVDNLIKSTKQNQLHISVISDLKPINQWYKYNICLLGDAAHATTPNMGQGACQAIEDAYVLSTLLAKYDFKTAFKAYQKTRFKKAKFIVKNSKRIGEIAHLKNPYMRTLRNILLRNTPKRFQRKQNDYLFQIPQL